MNTPNRTSRSGGSRLPRAHSARSHGSAPRSGGPPWASAHSHAVGVPSPGRHHDSNLESLSERRGNSSASAYRSANRSRYKQEDSGQQQQQSVSKNDICRRMNDPTAKAEAIRTVLCLLTNRGFAAPSHITPQHLNSPSKALYVAIMEFLIFQIDPTYKLLRPEDDIPRFFKDICCPLTITRSAIVAPGTPTTWPSLLTAMTWLCELILWDEFEHADTRSHTTVALEMEEGDRDFDQTSIVAYRKLLEGGSEDVADEIFESHWIRREKTTCQRLAESQKKLFGYKQRVEANRQNLFEFESMAEKIEKLVMDSQKLESAKLQCETTAKENNRSNTANEKKLGEMKDQLDKMQRENERLQGIVDSQEVNREEVLRIEEQMAQKRAVLTQLQDERAMTETDTLSFERENQSFREELLKISREINSTLSAASALSTENHFASSTTLQRVSNFDLRFDDQTLDDHIRLHGHPQESGEDEFGKPINQLALSMPAGKSDRKKRLSVQSPGNSVKDLDALLGLRWKTLKSDLKTAATEEVAALIKMREIEQNCRRTLEFKRNALETEKEGVVEISKRIEHCELDLKNLKRLEEQKLADIKEQIQEREREFKSVSVDLSTRIESARQKKEEMSGELQTHRSAVRSEMKNARRDVLEMAALASEFRSKVENTAQRVADDCEEKCREFEESASLGFRVFGDYSRKLVSL